MLEKEIAAFSHFIKPVIKTQYFKELPEGIATPSIYFPVPEVHGNEHSLKKYKNLFTLFMKVFDRDSLSSYSITSEIVNKIQAAGKMLPLYDADGKTTGETFLIKEVSAKNIDAGVTQLAVEWDAFACFHRVEFIKSEELHFGGMATSIEKEDKMAKNQADASEEKEAVEKKEKMQERRLPLETLRCNCVKLFGCTSSAFDGAFFCADCTKEYTVAEAKTIIQKWIGKEIRK